MNHESNRKDLSAIGLTVEQERLVIHRFVIYSILVTFFYTLLALKNILQNPLTEYFYSLLSTLVLIGIFSLYFVIRNHSFSKNYITIVFSLTAILSFFSFNGLTGLFIIDLINILIFTFILFNTNTLIRYGLYYLVLFGIMIAFQLLDKFDFLEPIVYFNDEIDAILFISTRLILTLNMIYYLKYRHNVERFKLMQTNLQFEKVNNQLNEANVELLHQNEEVSRQKKKIDDQNVKLKKIRQDLQDTNDTLEERILVRTEELIKVNGKLKKTLSELDRFVYSASHDLSAPLKSLLGLVQLVKIENQDHLLNDHFQHIEKSIIKQETVIKKLIQFSRNSRYEMELSQINLDLLIEDVISDFKYYPGFDTIEVIKNLPLSNVVSDESRLRIILNNLLSSAIKYKDHDKEHQFIHISSEPNHEYWSLVVQDNGQGISNKAIDKIFDMFYRANELSDGSGLGLFIVSEAVDKLRGSIKVNSEPGKGSTFLLKFPTFKNIISDEQIIIS